MNNRRRFVSLVLIVLTFIGCALSQQDVKTKLETPKPDLVIPVDWNRPISFTPKGGEAEILD